MIRSLFGSQKGSPPVKISIYLPHQSARAGTSLKGKVVCQVVSKEIIPGEVVELSIAGKEHAMLKVNGKRTQSERVFCRMAVPLRDFCDRRLGPGRCYTFPFSIKLPKTLPASCSFKMPNNEGLLQVEYKITAAGFFTSKEQEFQVTSAPLPDERVFCLKHPVSQPVKSLNVVDQGTLTLAASVKDTHVGRGDRIQLSLSCRNDSSVDIQRVEVKVQEIVVGGTTPSRDGNVGEEGSIIKRDIFVEKKLKISGLPLKRATNAEIKKMHTRSVAEKQQEYAKMHKELSNDTFLYEFLCPDTAHDTYKGKLLHVKHYIKIKLMTNSVTDNPSILIPLKIGNPPPRSPRRDGPPPASPTRRTREATTPNVEPSRTTPRRARSAPREPDPSSRMEPVALSSLVPLPPPLPVNPLPETPAEDSTEPRRSTHKRSQPDAVPTLSDVTPQLTPIQPPLTAEPEHAPITSSTSTDAAPSAAMAQSTPELPPYIAPSAPPHCFSESVPNLPPPMAPTMPPVSSSTSALPDPYRPPVVPSAPYFEEVEFPFLTAVPVPSDAVDAPVTVVDPSFVVMGGDAVLLEEDNYNARIQPHPRPTVIPSLSNLFDEMLVSVEDYDIIRIKLQDPSWRGMFERISPSDFGNIIARVNVDFDQPRVATLLAPVVNGGDNFTCQYCAAAVRSTSEWNRPTMVERLVPSCIDLRENHRLIRSELNEWDQLITARIMFNCID